MAEIPIDKEILVMEPPPKEVVLLEVSDDDDDEKELKHYHAPCSLDPSRKSCKPPALHFISVGWRSLGCEYNTDHTKLSADVVGKLSISHRASVDNPRVVIDCRSFGRHTGEWRLVHYCGEHYNTLGDLSKYDFMQSLLTEVMATILICEQHDCSSATILFLCTTGTHKSTAAARLAKEAFALHGYQTSLSHLSNGTWKAQKVF